MDIIFRWTIINENVFHKFQLMGIYLQYLERSRFDKALLEHMTGDETRVYYVLPKKKCNSMYPAFPTRKFMMNIFWDANRGKNMENWTHFHTFQAVYSNEWYFHAVSVKMATASIWIMLFCLLERKRTWNNKTMFIYLKR